MVKKPIKYLKIILPVLFGGGIFYWLYISLNASYWQQCILDNTAPEECNLANKLVADFLSADFFILAIMIFLFVTASYFRAVRWKILLSNIGHSPRIQNLLISIWAGFFLNLLPLRVGEAGKAVILSRTDNIALEEVFGTVISNRVVDALCLLALIFLAFSLEYDFILSLGKGDMSGLFKLCLGLIFIIIFFLLFKNRFKNSRFRILRGFTKGIESVIALKKPSIYLLHTFVIWFTYYLMFVVSFKMFAPTESLLFKEGAVVMTAGFLGMVFPSPGGMGTFHFFVTEAIKFYGVDKFDAFSFANIHFFTIQIFTFFLLGITAWILYQLNQRKSSNV